MVFLVPDEDDDLFGEEEDSSASEKAQLDTEELKETDLSAADDKVELDLEDAPFLEDEEEEEELPVEEGPSVSLEEEKPPDKWAFLKDKRIIGGLALLLLLAAGAAWYLWPREEPQPVEEKPPEAVEEKKPEEEGPPPPVEIIVSMDPFWVEYKDKQGEIRFLVCKIAAPIVVSVEDVIEKFAPQIGRAEAEKVAKDEALKQAEQFAWEIRRKKVVLRDAIFYYLRNKDLVFLSDKTNVDKLKGELLTVVNQYLSNSRLDDLLIEEYLVK